MTHKRLADLVVVLHFLFIVFAIDRRRSGLAMALDSVARCILAGTGWRHPLQNSSRS